MRTHLPGYLFRQDASFSPYDKGDAEEPGVSTAEVPASEPVRQGQALCENLCRRGDRHLAAGFLPEAFAAYVTAEEKGCPVSFQKCRPRVGMLKAALAMGRFPEAKRLAFQLRKKEDIEQEKLFLLIDGILAAFDQNFDLALERLAEAGSDWHRCPNLEGIAGHVLFRHRRYEDARNVFRVAMHSPWAAVRDFAILGLADCYVALGQWAEAEPLYESLARGASPLGLLGLAEFHVRQGKTEEARTGLNRLAATAHQDSWKGVALAYLISLTKPAEWAESLRIAERAKALVLPSYWAVLLGRKTTEALGAGILSLWEAGSHEELLILAEIWGSSQPELPRNVQLLIGKAYEGAGLAGSALEVYGRLSPDPKALFLGARLALKSGRYEEALTWLEQVLDLDSKDHKNDAKLLLACVHARRNRLDLAKESLRGLGRIQDPSLLATLGSLEASVGRVELAIDHLETALQSSAVCETERGHLHHRLGELNYRQGRFEEALRRFRQARGGEDNAPGSLTGPMEALCLARLGKPEPARAKLEKLAQDQETAIVKEILDAEDLLRAFSGKGYAD